ncbi:MAG: hypothetical protein MZW92_31420 [Comamonadaceae bacterium]|nr:hypothetical protein [Comamonadaceae bacterium]
MLREFARLVKDELINSANPSAIQPQAEDLALSNFASIGGSGYAGVPSVRQGTGQAASGYVFSPSLDVFDPTEYFDAASESHVNDGTPYYVRKASATRLKNGHVDLKWCSPVLDTAGRWLLTRTVAEDGRPVVQELLDSYLIHRVWRSSDRKELIAVVAHTTAVVGAIRAKLLVDGAVSEDQYTGLVTILDESLLDDEDLFLLSHNSRIKNPSR